MAVIRFVGPIASTINDEKLWRPGHLVHDHASSIARLWTRASKAAAPMNKRNRKFPGAPPRGSLKAGISTAVDREGTRKIGITQTSAAPYSVYVHGGTRPVIYSRSITGQFAKSHFRLPRNNFGPYKIVHKIKGQKANPFIYKGLRVVAGKHPAVAGAKQLFLDTPQFMLRRG